MSSTRIEKDIDSDLKDVDLKNQSLVYLDKGSFGGIYKFFHKNNFYALKKALVENESNIREKDMVDFLMDNPSPHVVTYFRYQMDHEYIYIAMEYVPKSLFTVLYKSESIGIEDKLMYGVAKAINYLHGLHVVHRDIKVDNFLVDDQGNIKICDFGFSTIENNNEPDPKLIRVGSLVYSAPEVIRTIENTQASDIYSASIVFWTIMKREQVYWPLASTNKADVQAIMRRVIYNNREKIPAKWPERLQKLITACWAADPKERPKSQYVEDELKELCNERSLSRS